MLQQTRVDTVIPYFLRFVSRFSTPADLASAPEEEVLKAWEGLGYYRRAKNLKRAMEQVEQRHNGEIPTSYEALIALPGVGPYMAGAILSIAFNLRYPAIDGNVQRVFARLFALPQPSGSPALQKSVHQLVEAVLPSKAPGAFNQALMDLGATLCLPRDPVCSVCPLRETCAAFQEGQPTAYPTTTPRPHLPEVPRIALLLRCAGEIAVEQRPTAGLLGGLWQLPSRDLQPSQPPDKAVAAWLLENEIASPKPPRYLGRIRHTFTHLRWVMEVFEVCPTSFVQGQGLHWVSPDELRQLTLPKAYHKALALAGLKL